MLDQADIQKFLDRNAAQSAAKSSRYQGAQDRRSSTTRHRGFGPFKQWCHEKALPFWAKHGTREQGGFHEFLDANASPIDTPQMRVRVQARMAYVYAMAGHLNWYEDARQLSDQAWELTIQAGSAGGQKSNQENTIDQYLGCASLIGSDNQLIDPLRDAYAQSFVILAGAWRYRAFGDRASLDIAKQTRDYLGNFMRSDIGGYFENHQPNSKPRSSITAPRRQNPHMHLFEAFMALYAVTKNSTDLALAGEIYELFKSVFFNEEHQTIIEFFNPDWSIASNQGGPTEPGHLMEWCWLLGQYASLQQDTPMGEHIKAEIRPMVEGLHQAALKHGKAPCGLLYDFVWPKHVRLNMAHMDAKPLEMTCRTWPQTERIKAEITLATLTDDPIERLYYLKQAATACDLLMRFYLTPTKVRKGGWYDQLDPHGRPINTQIPASTFYHIICACAQVDALGRSTGVGL